MHILQLSSGKHIDIEGDALSASEGVEAAQKLWAMFAMRADRVKAVLMYDVQPLHWMDCNHFEVGEEEEVRKALASGL